MYNKSVFIENALLRREELMCVSKLKIASYARVSYDEDKERYESIINQKNIIS